ncbi:hypothetical protein AAFF_G00160460 [Aldrovandia affinis]|uniref:Uncharacterized protein n=1 Tax=Aldrovandia affinis TaxID=143900 RepID=A0AAD7RMP0_9TELE|nr:hypothetical protein AAFF_G00160460 [Aldrovandia affinis]
MSELEDKKTHQRTRSETERGTPCENNDKVIKSIRKSVRVRCEDCFLSVVIPQLAAPHAEQEVASRRPQRAGHRFEPLAAGSDWNSRSPGPIGGVRNAERARAVSRPQAPPPRPARTRHRRANQPLTSQPASRHPRRSSPSTAPGGAVQASEGPLPDHATLTHAHPPRYGPHSGLEPCLGKFTARYLFLKTMEEMDLQQGDDSQVLAQGQKLLRRPLAAILQGLSRCRLAQRFAQADLNHSGLGPQYESSPWSSGSPGSDSEGGWAKALADRHDQDTAWTSRAGSDPELGSESTDSASSSGSERNLNTAASGGASEDYTQEKNGHAARLSANGGAPRGPWGACPGPAENAGSWGGAAALGPSSNGGANPSTLNLDANIGAWPVLPNTGSSSSSSSSSSSGVGSPWSAVGQTPGCQSDNSKPGLSATSWGETQTQAQPQPQPQPQPEANGTSKPPPSGQPQNLNTETNGPNHTTATTTNASTSSLPNSTGLAQTGSWLQVAPVPNGNGEGASAGGWAVTNHPPGDQRPAPAAGATLRRWQRDGGSGQGLGGRGGGAGAGACPLFLLAELFPVCLGRDGPGWDPAPLGEARRLVFIVLVLLLLFVFLVFGQGAHHHHHHHCCSGFRGVDRPAQPQPARGRRREGGGQLALAGGRRPWRREIGSLPDDGGDDSDGGHGNNSDR